MGLRLTRIGFLSLLLAATALALAGCGGGGGRRGNAPKPVTAAKPFALTSYFVTSPDAAVSGQLHASNRNGAAITYKITKKPGHGTASVGKNSGTLDYTPDKGFTGVDTLTYKATAAGTSSDPAHVVIKVNGDPPTVSAFGAPVYVTHGGPASVDLTVRLSNAPNGQATVVYTTSDGSAKAGTDYTSRSGILTFGPGVLSQTVTVPLSAAEHHAARYFYLKLSNPSGNLEMERSVAAAVIRYYPEPLNDTGVTGCASLQGNPSNPNTCPQAGYPAQDADIGRTADASSGDLVQAGSGNFGYDFTALGFDGKPTFNQDLTQNGYSVQPWACLRDNWTGLVWEVPQRVAGAGLYDTSYHYTWYNPDSNTNGGSDGKARGGRRKLDTYHFVKKVNNAKLCGFSDWRLPTAAELRNLVNIGAPGTPEGPLPPIPTLASGAYWTATPGNMPSRATAISAAYGYDSFVPKTQLYYVILVRGGESQ
jgi:hypothetical protein